MSPNLINSLCPGKHPLSQSPSVALSVSPRASGRPDDDVHSHQTLKRRSARSTVKHVSDFGNFHLSGGSGSTMWFFSSEFCNSKHNFQLKQCYKSHTYSMSVSPTSTSLLRRSSSGDMQLIRGFGNYLRDENASVEQSSQCNEAIGTETSGTTSWKVPFTKEGGVEIGRCGTE